MDRVDYQPLIIQDLINWKKHDELNLSPWYQRRSVWTTPQKSYLLNTLFEQKPMPTLYFRHAVDLDEDKSIREVVDGQQRITSIYEYIDNIFSARHPEYTKKVFYKDLSSQAKKTFRETKISGGWLLGADDSDVIEVFARINSVAKTLNAQESRNAKFGGEFKQYCLREAASRVAIWRQLNVFSANDIARMKEVEYVSDIVYNLLNGLSDFSAVRLNSIYAENEDVFSERVKVARRVEKIFSLITAIPASTIKDTIFRRQPIFFSLAIVLDKLTPKPSKSLLIDAIMEIDRRYNSDKPLSDRPQIDAEFYEACKSSTQRIASRKVRNKYITRFLTK